jgi:hypothetical protein
MPVRREMLLHKGEKGNMGLPVSLIQWQLLKPWSMTTDKDNWNLYIGLYI